MLLFPLSASKKAHEHEQDELQRFNILKKLFMHYCSLEENVSLFSISGHPDSDIRSKLYKGC